MKLEFGKLPFYFFEFDFSTMTNQQARSEMEVKSEQWYYLNRQMSFNRAMHLRISNANCFNESHNMILILDKLGKNGQSVNFTCLFNFTYILFDTFKFPT